MSIKSILLGVALAVSLSVTDSLSAADASLKTQKEKVSYAVGFQIGNNLDRQGYEVDVDTLAQAIKDVVNGGQPKMDMNESRSILQTYQKELQAKAEAKRAAQAEPNKKAGAAFLAENKKKAGVVELPSGLQYKVIKSGSGKAVGKNDTVTVNYKGTLIDGTEFDSSYKRGQPATFNVKGVIKGWTEALLKMKEGDKWQLFIPSDLAYGDRAMGASIPPGSTLVFEVELIKTTSPKPITSDIIKVPSAEEMAKGAKIETIKAEDLEKLEAEAKANKNKK